MRPYVEAMEKDSILHMRVAEETKAKIDILRKNEPDLPSRSEMVRRLVDRAENAIGGRK